MMTILANELTISIADLPITLQFDQLDVATRTKIVEHYADFIVPSAQAHYWVKVRVEPGAEFIPFGFSMAWQIRTTRQNDRIDFESHCEKGWVDGTTRRGELVIRPRGGNIENFLRVLYAWLCIEHGSLLLHACGIIRDRRGYVFFGPSGNGKTTTARLSSQYTILSDDLIIIKKHQDRFIVCGTPFRGDLPEAPRTNQSAELVGVFALTKDTRHYLAPLASSEAVARLVQCVPFVMSQPENAMRVTDICVDLVNRVSVQMLHFRRDAGFWELIR